MKLEIEVNLKEAWNYDNEGNLRFNGNFSYEDLKKIYKMENQKMKLILEVEEPILDEVERKYLSGVIRPFRDRVKYISKCGGGLYQDEFIQIGIKNEGTISLPFFKTGTMYKKLEQNEEYKLDDLGL